MNFDNKVIFENYQNSKLNEHYDYAQENINMSIEQLRSIAKKSHELCHLIHSCQNELEPWVFAKIVEADQLINTVHEYLNYSPDA